MVFKYEDQGVSTLEDGLYVLEDKLADEAFKEKMVKFVRASMKGWKYAEENTDEAAMIVLENDASGAQTEEHQKRMMGEIAKLTAGTNGALDEADYQRTVKTLLSAGDEPVITAEPQGAWTSEITDQALVDLQVIPNANGRVERSALFMYLPLAFMGMGVPKDDMVCGGTAR